MIASVAPPSARPAADQAPQLRTLLLTDLCDSTALVERIGARLPAEVDCIAAPRLLQAALATKIIALKKNKRLSGPQKR